MLGTTRQARAGCRRAGRSSAFLSSFLSHRARCLLLHLDLDVGSRHANAVSHSGSLGRRTYDFARPNVECGAVPGTGHFSISERPTAVGAGVVEREELAVDVEQGNLLALHLDQTRLTRLDLSCPRWPGNQHCEITFVPIIPVSFGENERAAIALT